MTIGAGWYLVHEIFAAFTRITEKAGEAQSGEPTYSKDRFIPEFLLDKETVPVNWERRAEDGLQVRGGFGPVDASHQRTHQQFKAVALNLGPRHLITFPTLSQGNDLLRTVHSLVLFSPKFFIWKKTRVGLPTGRTHSELESSRGSPSNLYSGRGVPVWDSAFRLTGILGARDLSRESSNFGVRKPSLKSFSHSWGVRRPGVAWDLAGLQSSQLMLMPLVQGPPCE